MKLAEKVIKFFDRKIEESDKWVIMNARALYGKMVTAHDVANEIEDGVIHQVLIDDKSNAYVSGSSDSPYAENGVTVDYVQDTGTGYGKKGWVTVQSYAIVKGGKIVKSGEGFDGTQKRAVWVFK